MTTPVQVVQDPIKSAYVADGPIAGIMANQDAQNAQDAQARAFRDNDLSFQEEQNKYQNDLLDNPVKEAQRQLDLGNKGIDQANIDSGMAAQMKTADMEAKIQKSLSEKTVGQLQDIAGKATFGLGVNKGMIDEQTSVDFMKNKDYYENSVLPHAKALGITDLPKEWGPAAKDQLNRMEQQSIQTAPQIQQSLKLAQEGQQQLAVENVKGRYQVAALAGQGAQAAGMAVLNMDPDKQMEKEVIKKASDGTLTPEDITKYKAVIRDKYLSSPAVAGELNTAKQDDLQQAQFKQGDNKTQYEAMMVSAGLPKDATPGQYATARMKDRVEAMVDQTVKARLGADTVAKVMSGQKQTPSTPPDITPQITKDRLAAARAMAPRGALPSDWIPQGDGSIKNSKTGQTAWPNKPAAPPPQPPAPAAGAPPPLPNDPRMGMANQIPQ